MVTRAVDASDDQPQNRNPHELIPAYRTAARPVRSASGTVIQAYMNDMKPHKPNKYSLFKSNRSQASLLSNQSLYDRGPDQPSPIDSPLHSPAVPPPSAASSPLSPDDNDRDDILARNYEADAARFHQSNTHTKPNVLQRSQSQRASPSPRIGHGPTINLVSPTHGGVAASPTIDEDPDTIGQESQQAPHLTQNLKKKRRFFGLGGESSSVKEVTHTPSPNPARGLGRSISVRRTGPQPQISTDVGTNSSETTWPLGSSSAKFPSPTVDEEPEGEQSLHPSSPHGKYSTPPIIPPKDSPKSPLFLPTFVPEHRHNEQHPQSSVAASGQLQPLEQVAAKIPSLERVGRTPGTHQQNSSSELQTQYQAFQPVHSSAGSSASHQLHSRSTQDLTYPQPLYPQRNSRPSSRQSYEPPSPSQPQHLPFHHGTSSLQAVPLYSENTMVPPATQPHSGGRSSEQNQQNTQSVQARDNPNYAYSERTQGTNQSGQPTAQYGSQLGVNNNNQQGGSYRNTPQASPMVQQNSNSEQGRSTPPPSRSRDDLSGLDFQQLLTRHDELNDKYRKVKKFYFDKDAQVQQLQNTLAHQRLAQSRTSLDDAEYANRFSRLDGAINNLAFNIRKDWRIVPPWLASCVNKDATQLGTKEMTAVGRACISRWLVEELLDRYFHPALEPNLSCQLKIIEKNLRRFSPPTQNEEEKEALLARISNWRLATLDGLADMLASPGAASYRNELTDMLVEMLTTDLKDNLREPAPPGLDVGVEGIVELAVGIAANVPLESRDVYVNYIMPGTIVNDIYMRVEGALPALTNPGEGLGDSNSIDSADEKEEADQESLNDVSPQQQQSQQQQQHHQQAQQQTQQQAQQAQQQNKKKPGMLSGLLGNKKPVAGPTAPGNARAGGSAAAEAGPQAPKEERVRFAAFMSVEVRGKNMLIRAPVYT
ncbi:hypothetical protein MMC26_004581 [Xylographa opegraphella]|nr:hypothetical protein [Xylographa opegraphella]